MRRIFAARVLVPTPEAERAAYRAFAVAVDQELAQLTRDMDTRRYRVLDDMLANLTGLA